MPTRLASRRNASRRILAIVILLSCGPFARGAAGATATWINPSGGIWSSPNNWSGGKVPAAGDDVQIILNGTYTVMLDIAATLNNLSLGGPSGTQTLAIGSDLTLNGTGISSANGVLKLAGGNLGGSGILTVDGAMSWSFGSMFGSGATTISSSGTLTVSATPGVTMDSRTLINGGTILWVGTGAGAGTTSWGMINGAVIDNSGTFDIQGDAAMGHKFGSPTMFKNTGVIRKSSGPGTTTFATTELRNDGSIQVQSGVMALEATFTQSLGSPVLSGGSFSSSKTLVLAGGVLTGAGTLTGDLSNPGAVVAPGSSGAGVLVINGKYIQGPGGALNIELGGTLAGTQYDQMKVVGTATLDGTLNVTEIGGFVPAAGAVFQVLLFSSKSGDFVTQNGLDLGSGKKLVPTYGGTDLSLVTTQTSLASATVSGSASICAGASATIQVVLAGSPPWSLAWSDGFNQSGISKSPATRTVSPASTTTYSVTTVTDANGSNPGSGSATITVNPAPSSPSVRAPATATPGQPGLTASVASNAGSTYAWGISNGVITGGNGTSTIMFSAGSAGPLTLTVAETNASGCASPQAGATVNVIAPGTLAVTISGAPLSGAVPFSTAFSATASGGTGPYTYSWSTGESGAIISHDWTIPGSYDVTCSARDSASLSATSNTLTVTANGIPGITTFSANPPSIPSGGSSILSWTTANAAFVSIDQGVGSILPANGSVSVKPAATTTYTLTATSPAGTKSATTTVTVTGVCAAPGTPAFFISSDNLTSGQAYVALWSAASGLLSGGSYILETSGSPGFSPLLSASITPVPSATVPTSASGSDRFLYVRVRALQPCGIASANSSVLTLSVKSAPADFHFITGGPAWSVNQGSTPQSSTVTILNVGGLSGLVSFATSGGFFTANPASIAIDPGARATVTLAPLASALATPGFYDGLLTGSFGAGSVSTPVTLTVTPPQPAADLAVRSSASRVVFSAPSGQSPSSQTLTLSVSAPTSARETPLAAQLAYLTPSIGPGGSWLVLRRDELSRPISPGGQMTLTLAVDRSRRTRSDGMPPLKALLKIAVVGAPDDSDRSALIEVTDFDTPLVTSNAGASRPTTGTSFILPTTVRAEGQQGATFFSDGWLKNVGSKRLDIDFFYTPDGKDGSADPGVLKSIVSAPPGATLRMSDLLGSLFATTGSGQVEVRSNVPEALTVRATAESVTGGDPTSRYGTEVPTVSSGSGVGVNDPALVIPGIDDDRDNRANLILTETTGSSVGVLVTVYDSDGTVVGSLTRTLFPHSKSQINSIVSAVAPGRTLSGGSLSVKAAEGQGRVLAVATVIDNRSNSFSAIKGRTPRGLTPPATAEPKVGSLTSRAALVVPTMLIIPSAVRLTGARDTHFTTNVAMVNPTGTPSVLSMTYEYVDVADGNQRKSVQRSVTIPARGAMKKAIGTDLIANLFALTTPSYGWMKMEGDVSRVVVVAAISAAVDPNDPAKGSKAAQVDGILSDSPAVMLAGTTERRFAGIEKSAEKRTNLVLVETAGVATDAIVRLYSSTGQKMAERGYSVQANQYLQINDIFGEAGVGLGEGPFQNIEVTAQVTSGQGRLVALATVNDNVSRNPEIFVLTGNGPAAPSPGF